MKNIKKKSKKTIEQYVCSLIDILGQKEKLQQLNGLLLKENQELVLFQI